MAKASRAAEADAHRWRAAATRTFDVLVVGGGVHGMAVARDAALRGLSTCLVERRDFGAGTTAYSSRLAHGGLRYLAHLDLGLVREALRERGRWLASAPHLVEPIPFVVPVMPGTLPRPLLRLAMMLYQGLAGRDLPRYEMLGPEAVQEALPGIQTTGLRGGARFYDGRFRHVGRIIAEMRLDAEEHGAILLAEAPVSHLLFGHEGATIRVHGAMVEGPQGQIAIRARTVVNATGCGIDELLGPLAPPRPSLRLTKGVHLVVPRFTSSGAVFRALDGRTFFIIPAEEGCLIGTTDTEFAGDPDEARADAADIAYLQASLERYFPDLDLDIEWTYAGVRALVHRPGKVGRVTRKNVTRRDAQGLYSMLGGKLTTARATAEKVVDLLAKTLGRGHGRPTRTRSLPGAPGLPWPRFRAEAQENAAAQGIPPWLARRLIDTYGALWRRVLAAAGPESRTRITRGHDAAFVEVAWAVQVEQAHHLDDVILRRLCLPPTLPDAAVAAICRAMASHLGWDDVRMAVERRRYADAVARHVA